jgi:ribosomal protein S18 acetylase RimI-like enzyme
VVELIPMNQEQFEAFLKEAIPAYADEKVESGAWKEDEAMRLSGEAYARLLPEGLKTKGSYLYMVRAPEQDGDIGYIWLHVPEVAEAGLKKAFLYEIKIHESYQGQGYGKKTMTALDAAARELGASSIGLHVFGHNQRAFRLYERMGYEVTDYQMRKTL